MILREDGVARDSHLATQERVVGLVGALLDDAELLHQELEDLDELRAVVRLRHLEGGSEF